MSVGVDRLPRRPPDRPLRPRPRGPAVAASSPIPVPPVSATPHDVRHQPRAAAPRDPGRRGAARAAAGRRRPAAGERLPGDGRAVDRAQRRRVGPAASCRVTARRSSTSRRSARCEGAAWCSTRRRSPTDPAQLQAEVAQPNSVLVVTDSNRKRARRWTSVRDVYGETERVDQTALVKDENDNRLDVFPDAGYRRVHRRPDARRRGEHEPLRRSGLLPAGGARVARVRRRRRPPRGRSARTAR